MCYINKFDWSLDYQFDYNRLLHPNHHWNLTRTISLAMLHQTKAQNCSEPEAMLFWQLCRSEWEEFGQKWIKWKKIKTLRRVTKRRAGGSRPDRSGAAWTVVQPGYSLQSRQQSPRLQRPRHMMPLMWGSAVFLLSWADTAWRQGSEASHCMEGYETNRSWDPSFLRKMPRSRTCLVSFTEKLWCCPATNHIRLAWLDSQSRAVRFDGLQKARGKRWKHKVRVFVQFTCR